MTTAKHTPGPWRLGTDHGGDTVRTEDGGAVAVTRVATRDGYAHTEAEDVANACLIAAAPELLEALLWLVNTSCDVGKSGEPPTMAEHHAAIDAGKVAIAKATR